MPPRLVAERSDVEGISTSQLPCRISARCCVSGSARKERTHQVTHANYPLKVTSRVCPQDLHCNLPTIMFSLPHVRKSAPERCVTGAVVANRNFQGSWKNCMAAAYPVQQLEAFFFAPIPGYLANPVPSWKNSPMSTSISMSGCKTCLVYHINKCLCVVPKEGMDHAALIPT